jgi:hypothetical protein
MTDDGMRAALAAEYEVGEELGRGRWGVVYRARPVGGEAEVALKVTVLAPGSTAYERFGRETSVTASLRHPHIMPVLGSGTAGEFAYAVGPIAVGTVADLLHTEQVVAPERAAPILRDAAAALDHAHAQGVLHGALAPEKLLLDADGRCRVADFELDPADEATHEHVLRSSVGSLAYMSPEQRRDSLELDGTSDQYALAIVAHEMISGVRRVAEWHDGEPTTFNPIDIAPNRPLRDGVPPEVNGVLRRALSRFPDQRYPTTAAFAEALVAAYHPAVAPAPESAPGWLRGRGAKLLLATVGPPVIAVGIVLVLTEPGTWSAARTTGIKVGRALTVTVPSMLTRQRESAARERLPSARTLGTPSVSLPDVPLARSAAGAVGGGSSSSGGGGSRGGSDGGGAAGRYGTPTGSAAGTGTPRSGNGGGGSEPRSGTPSGGGIGTLPLVSTSGGGAERAPDRSAEAEPSSGQLTVTVDDGTAFVVVDGLVRGLTPYASSVSPGRHTVSVRSLTRRYRPATTSVVVGR